MLDITELVDDEAMVKAAMEAEQACGKPLNGAMSYRELVQL